nr:uncharacterized protein LOC111416695 [Onthophagus taurus]
MGEYFTSLNDSWPFIEEHKFVSRGNMTGVTLTSAIVIPDGTNYTTISEYLADESNRGSNSQHRFQCILMGYCRDFYNFTLKTQRTDSWGYTSEGVIDFDGLVGLLQHKSVDIGCTPLIFRSDRLMVVDYCHAGWILRSVFIFRPVSVTPDTISVFTKPLSVKVWWSLLASMCLFIICLKIISSSERNIVENVRNVLDVSWSYIILNVFGALCLQGTMTDSSLNSGRITILSMSILCVLIYQFYSGFIVSSLLMMPHKAINSLLDLISSSLDAGIEDILIDRDFIRYAKDKIILDLYHTKVEKPNHDGFYKPADGMEKVLQGGFAFHVETSSAYPLIKETFPTNVLCELQEIQMYHTQFMYSSVQKQSHFRELINYCVLRMYENGIMHRMRSLWDAKKPNCLSDTFVELVSVGLEEFSAALYILLFGCVASILILLGEISWNKYKRN